MSKKKYTIQSMKFRRHNRIAIDHLQEMQYIVAITV